MSSKNEVIDARTKPGRGLVYRWNTGRTMIRDAPFESIDDGMVTVDRARLERLIRVAGEAYASNVENIIKASRSLQPGDLDMP